MRKIFIFMLFLTMWARPAMAFWVWTPESGRWVNPKYDVKPTPQKQLEAGLEAAQTGDFAKAVQEMQKLIRHYPEAREAAEAQFYIGRFLNEQGELYKAFQAYQQVIKKYPFTTRSAEIVEAQYKIGCEMLDGKNRPDGIWAKLRANPANITEVFETVIKNAPYGEFAAPAQYKIGLFLKGQGLWQEARDAFEKTINDYPASDWATSARYQVALVDAERSAGAAYDQQITQAAIDQFEGFAREYPDAELSQEATVRVEQLRQKEAENNFLIAEFYDKHGQYESAKIYYNIIISDFKETPWASKALERLQQLGETK